MSLIAVVLTLVVIGFGLWLVEKYVPMNPRIRQVLYAVVLIVVALWLLGPVFGLLPYLTDIRTR